jgi:hypothetical protein
VPRCVNSIEVLVVEVLIAQRWQNSTVPTYSENGAMFPNHGMGSPFCKPNEKIQDEGCKKTRHLSEKSGDRNARSRGTTRRSLRSHAPFPQ